jgi:hypothetical protein
VRLTFAFILLPLLVCAQFTYRQVNTITVVAGPDTLRNAWAGGFNAGQFNTLDVNADSQPDLILYDRMAERVMVFLRTEAGFVHAPEYEGYFPAGIVNYLLLRDFNADGKKDLFTGDVLGIKVFKNITPPGSPPAWQQVFFNTGFGTKSPVLLTTGFSGKVNLQQNFDDMPAFRDADGDGDLDIFCARYPTGSNIEFHKNMGIERFGTADSLDFERITQTWGQVADCFCGVFAFEGQPCNTTGGRTTHAGGKSLEVIDINADGHPDLLFSESDCSRVYLLENLGTLQAPVIQSAVPFPAPNPVLIFPFPSVYPEDVDADGATDLIATSNAYRREYLFSNFRESVHYYRNTGTNTAPAFALVQTNFLQHTMIDVGDNAVPAFMDLDGDGDLDLLIGHYAYDGRATLVHFENIGTARQPVFRHVTNDYAFLSLYNFTNIKPAFADMNGDSRPDLVFSATQGTGTALYFLPNTATSGLTVNPLDIRSLGFSLFSSENVSIIDVNADGKPDILLGKSNGALQYWQNNGTPENPSFTLTQSAWLGLGSSVTRQSLSCAEGDLDADGLPDLVIGDQTGRITIVPNYREALSAENEGLQEVVYNPLTERYEAPNLGGRLWPVVVNLLGTERPLIVAGTITGGLVMLQPENLIGLPEHPRIDVYPNPVQTSQNLNIRLDRPGSFTLINLLGQTLSAPHMLQPFRLYRFPVAGLEPGMYLLRFVIEGKTYTRRIMVQ